MDTHEATVRKEEQIASATKFSAVTYSNVVAQKKQIPYGETAAPQARKFCDLEVLEDDFPYGK